MNPLRVFYVEVIYRPLLNALMGVYLVLPYRDLGAAIIVFTVLVRLAMHPLIARTTRTQKAMANLQPKLRDIRSRNPNDREAQARETMALYREAGVQPLAGCLPILIQLPILIGLYRVFWQGIHLADRSLLYALFPVDAAFNPVSFGLIDLTARSPVLALAAGLAQLAQGWIAPPAAGGSGDMERAIRWQTRYMLPVIVAAISWSLPSALALYWTVFSVIAIVQQRWIESRLSHESASPTNQRDRRPDGHPR